MRTLLVLFPALILGCSASTSPTSTDMTVSPGDLSTAGDLSAPIDMASGGSDGGALVAQCQAMANQFQTLCAGVTDRVCLWGAYSKLCAIGKTQLLIDSMKCLDNTTCRTFSDANMGAACLKALHGTAETVPAKVAIQSVCMDCKLKMDCATVDGQSELLPYLSDADLNAIPNCRGTACDYSPFVKACAALPGFVPFVPCAM